MRTPNPLLGEFDDTWPELGVRSLAHRLADGVVAAATSRAPGTVLGAIDALSSLLAVFHVTGPTPEQVAALFGTRVAAEAREIARRSAALRFKNHAALALLQKKGLAALADRVSSAHAQPPASLVSAKRAILLSSHVGVHNGVSAALHRWGIEAFVLPLQGVDQPQRRAMALRTAIDVLRDGGRVLAVMDGPFGAHSAPVDCLGRRIVLRRGAFALACLTNAVMLPAVARWSEHGDIEPFVDEPLPAAPGRCGERELTRLAASWLERYLTAHPEEAWPYTIANFLDAPLAARDAVGSDVVLRQVTVS